MTRLVTVDLRRGYRIEVTATILPKDQYAARLMERRDSDSGRTTYKQVGPNVLASHADRAAMDLLNAVNTGQLPGVDTIA